MFENTDKTAIKNQVSRLQAVRGFANSNKKFARTLTGITDTDLSHLYADKWIDHPKRISLNKWVSLARLVGYQKNALLNWHTAETSLYSYITDQLQACQSESLTGMLVDDAGIGKTHTAQLYAKNHRNVYYIDCSVTPRKIAFVRRLSRVIGLDDNGRIEDLTEDIIYTIQNTEQPLIILDEAGDMDDRTMLVIKRLYNALEGFCGFYLLGADGLKTKIERGIKYKKLGYIEFFSRFDRSFKRATPLLMDKKLMVYQEMAIAISLANGITREQDINRIVGSLHQGNTLHDMRKVRKLIIGIKKHERKGK